MLQHLNTSAGVFLLFLIYSTLGWCGEMIYCSIGQLEKLMEDVLDGNGTLETIDLIESTASSIF